jgi:predicted HAD superfamily phosphohydrolase YqeG
MIKRIAYALKMTFIYRHKLTNIYCHSKKYNCILDLNVDNLSKLKIKILVLDFDGVLASHGEEQPNTQVKVWLDNCVETLGVENIFILSNNPLKNRVAYFAKNYKGLVFINSLYKKPYPNGLKKIINLSNVNAENIALVDDRLLTGVLATCIAKTQAIYINKPYIGKRIVKEIFFMSLRIIERSIFKIRCWLI